MRKKFFVGISLAVTVLLSAGCSAVSGETDLNTEESTAGSDETAATESTEDTHATASTVTLTEGTYDETELDDTWNADAVEITLSDEEIQIEGTGASVDENTVTISEEGTYVLSGSVSDGNIIVNVADKGNVKLVLNNAEIRCSDYAPISIQEGTVVITLAPESENYLEDGAEYNLENEETEPSAAIFSKDDLTFNGSGTLTLMANYNNGIQSKDDLKFVSGTYVIEAADVAIVGKDSVSVKDGNFELTAGKDGIRATNYEDTEKGYVIIDGGSFSITAENDGIQAETLLRINEGNFTVTSGGGSENAVVTVTQGMPQGGKFPADMETSTEMEAPSDMEAPAGMERPEGEAASGMEPPADMERPEGEAVSGMEPPADMERPEGDMMQEMETSESEEDTTESTKGMKSYVDMVIAGGTFQMNTCDDAFHSKNSLEIQGGTFEIQAGDDGIHGDNTVTIQQGTIHISESCEGIEGYVIQINGGDIDLTASDDGINAAGEEANAALEINGGTVCVNAGGDGLDANGNITMTGGYLEVQGPENNGNGTFDYDQSFLVSGGTLIGAGTPGMAQEPEGSMEKAVLTVTLSEALEAGNTVSLSSENGEEILSFETVKQVQWLVFSDEILEEGGTYILKYGDTQETVEL